jgi:tetratricopeptide (TPR) repeat protein
MINPRWIALTLAALTFLVYSRTLTSGCQFLNVDDPEYVTANPHVRAGLSLDGFVWAWTAFHAYNWHPLTWLSLQLDHQLFGLSSIGFHFTNVLLHAANAVLLFWLLLRMTGATWPAAFVAALFALHPTHVESVAWVTERKDTLSTLFWLLTMLAYVRYAERPGVTRYLLVLLVFALGLAAKPMLVTLPFVLLLMDYWPLRRWPTGGLWRLLLEKLPLILLVAATIPLTVRAQGVAVRTFEQIPLLVRIQNALVSYVKYLYMNAVPVNLAIFYPHPFDTIPLWQPLAAALFLLLITALVLRYAKRLPYLPVGWFWYVGTLVPVIGLMQVGLHELADRYLYVPSIGFFLLVVWGGAELARRRPAPALAAAGLLLAVFAGLTIAQVEHWRNSEALWRHALAVTRDNATAHDYLGQALLRQGKLDEAEHHFRQSLRIRDVSSATHGNLAILLAEKGELDEAARHFVQSLRVNPDSALAYTGLAGVRIRQDRLDDARKLLQHALSLEPRLLDARRGLGKLAEAEGDLAEAETQYRTAVADWPGASQPRLDLAHVLRRRGKHEQALSFLEQLVQTERDSPAVHDHLGQTLEALRRLPEAIEHYDRAVDGEPGNLLYRVNLAHALSLSGQVQAAKEQLDVAASIAPGWPEQARKEAWDYATHPNPRKRAADLAMRLARLACLGTGYHRADCLEALAAAHAQLQQFEQAVEWQQKALELIPADAADQRKHAQERLQRYRGRQAP